MSSKRAREHKFLVIVQKQHRQWKNKPHPKTRAFRRCKMHNSVNYKRAMALEYRYMMQRRAQADKIISEFVDVLDKEIHEETKTASSIGMSEDTIRNEIGILEGSKEK